MQISFVTKQSYNPLNIGTMSFVIPSILFVFMGVDANNYFWGVAVLCYFVFLEMTVSIVKQCADILNIRVFSIEKVEKRDQ